MLVGTGTRSPIAGLLWLTIFALGLAITAAGFRAVAEDARAEREAAEERARAEKEAALREMQDWRREMDRLASDLAELEEMVDHMIDRLVACSTEGCREHVKAALQLLRAERTRLENERRGLFGPHRTRNPHGHRGHVSEDCMRNPLAKECM